MATASGRVTPRPISNSPGTRPMRLGTTRSRVCTSFHVLSDDAVQAGEAASLARQAAFHADDLIVQKCKVIRVAARESVSIVRARNALSRGGPKCCGLCIVGERLFPNFADAHFAHGVRVRICTAYRACFTRKRFAIARNSFRSIRCPRALSLHVDPAYSVTPYTGARVAAYYKLRRSREADNLPQLGRPTATVG